jgi:FixJ family two-component response regulator
VVLDLRMGNVDGATLLDAVAVKEKKPNVTVVTGYPDVWERVKETHRTEMVGATLFKPVDVDAVIDTAVKRCG